MGRRNKRSNQQETFKVKFPNRRKGEMFARVLDIYGQDRMEVFCEDGKRRIGRIRGKIKKRVWIREGDLVLVNPWDFETPVPGKKEKCEIFWRYPRHKVSWLKRRGKFPKKLDINNIPVF